MSVPPAKRVKFKKSTVNLQFDASGNLQTDSPAPESNTVASRTLYEVITDTIDNEYSVDDVHDLLQDLSRQFEDNPRDGRVLGLLDEVTCAISRAGRDQTKQSIIDMFKIPLSEVKTRR